MVGLLLLVPASLSGQAALRGKAVFDTTSAPVAGAEVILEGTNVSAISDSQGRFTLAPLPVRISRVIVRKVGFRPVAFRVMIFRNVDTVEVEAELVPTVYELPALEVAASSVPDGMEPFGERRANGFGKFIDWTVLRQSEHRKLSDVLTRVAGVRIETDRRGRLYVGSSRGSPMGGRCTLAVWLEGTPMRGLIPSIDDFPVAQLEAIEVYRGPSETPSQLRGGPQDSCGAIVLWQRRQ